VDIGETIVGLDMQRHLWVVLSAPDAEGNVAVANLTTHGKPSCGDFCVVVTPAEHPFLRRDSCVYYRGASLNPVAPLDEYKTRGALNQSVPMPAEVVKRIQDGALASKFTQGVVKDAIRASM